MSRAGRLLESRENARPAARLGTARHGSMILPIAPWEQKRTLLRQAAAASLNAAASCLNVASRLLFNSAALQGSSLTARLPTEPPQHGPVQGHRAARSPGGLGML